jgi:hypothetical protein
MKQILHLDNCSLFTEDSCIRFELWYVCVLYTLQTCMIITNFIWTFPCHENHPEQGCNTQLHAHLKLFPLLKLLAEMQIPFPLIQVHKIHIITSYLIQVYGRLQSLSAKEIFSTHMQYIPIPSGLLKPKQFMPHSTDTHLPYTTMQSTKPQACTMLRSNIWTAIQFNC